MAAGAIFRAIPLSWWLVGVLLALSGLQGWRMDRIKGQRDEARSTVAAYEKSRQQAEDAAKAEKARVVKAHTAIVEDLSHALDQSRAVAARLKLGAVGLRDANEALRKRVETATAAGFREAADAAIRVQADVLGECRSQLATVAGHADESRARGLACERAYDELMR